MAELTRRTPSRQNTPIMRSRERGFIVTLGVVLLLTVIFVGLFVGIASVRDAWFKKKAFETSVDVYVLGRDPNDPDKSVVLGKAVDFDEHETPLVPFVDYDVPNSKGEDANYRVLVGVRDDRFTTRERIYYPDTEALNCTGTPCIFEPSTETAALSDGGATAINSQGVDELPGTGGVSYQLATQAGGGPDTIYNYGVGAKDGKLPGRLYRQTETECPLNIPEDPTANVYISYWQSQRVVETGGGGGKGNAIPPCYKFLVAEPAGEETDALKCQPGKDAHFLPGSGNDPCTASDDPGPPPIFCRTVFDTPNDDSTHRCSDDGDANWGGDQYGACPEGGPGIEDDWELQPFGNNSGWCCPPGLGEGPGGAGQCQQASKNYFNIEEGIFLQAEDVINSNTGKNVLDGLIILPGGKATVNLPINPDGWKTLPPGVGPYVPGSVPPEEWDGKSPP